MEGVKEVIKITGTKHFPPNVVRALSEVISQGYGTVLPTAHWQLRGRVILSSTPQLLQVRYG